MRLFSTIGLLVPSRHQATRASQTPIIEGVTLEAIADVETLRIGWRRVRANRGGPGGDGVTVENFANDLDERLANIAKRLQRGAYRPGRLKRYRIPKKSGGHRQLAVPCVGDRVVQSAVLGSLGPQLEPRMSQSSWAYRPGRGVVDALREVRQAFADGFSWTVDADIARYFDRVPHRRLIDELTIWIDDERIISLFALWLRSFTRRGVGIAQGSPISPLLANLYLHPVDRQISTAGYPLVRYADDLVIMTRTEKEALTALALLRSLLQSRGLTINTAKTTIRGPDDTFRFLGETLRAPQDQNGSAATQSLDHA